MNEFDDPYVQVSSVHLALLQLILIQYFDTCLDQTL